MCIYLLITFSEREFRRLKKIQFFQRCRVKSGKGRQSESYIFRWRKRWWPRHKGAIDFIFHDFVYTRAENTVSNPSQQGSIFLWWLLAKETKRCHTTKPASRNTRKYSCVPLLYTLRKLYWDCMRLKRKQNFTSLLSWLLGIWTIYIRATNWITVRVFVCKIKKQDLKIFIIYDNIH